MPITHDFVSAKEDGADATLVRPSDWNADHIGTALEVQEDDVKVADADIVNFEGGGGKVTDEGGGKVTVNITPGAGGGGESQLAAATSDLTLTTTKQDVPGATLSLEAGTWVVIGVFRLQCSSYASLVGCRGWLDVGGVVQNQKAIFAPTVANQTATVLQTWRLVLSSLTTVKLQADKGADTGTYFVESDDTNITAIKT